MIRYKRGFLLLAAGLVMSAGNLRAEEAASASNAQAAPAAKAAVVSKAVKSDSQTSTGMKAALALAADGKTAEAIAAYEKMGVQKSPKAEAWRLNNEGLAYLQATEPAPDKALPFLEKAVAADAGNYVAWNNIGIAYEQTDKFDKAKEAYQKSIDAAKASDAASTRAEGNLQSLKDRLDKRAAKAAAKAAKEAAKAAKKAGVKAKPAVAPAVSSTPVAGGTEAK